MDTQTIIQASAQVVTITNLKAGDAYKRFQENSYGDDAIQFGVVQDVMHNGTDAAFTAFEFDGYTAEAKLKVYKAGADLAMFAATPDEIRTQIESVVAAAQRRLKDARDVVEKAERVVELAVNVYSSISDGALTAPDTIRAEVSA